jgi:hypothetical protein
MMVKAGIAHEVMGALLSALSRFDDELQDGPHCNRNSARAQALAEVLDNFKCAIEEEFEQIKKENK